MKRLLAVAHGAFLSVMVIGCSPMTRVVKYALEDGPTVASEAAFVVKHHCGFLDFERLVQVRGRVARVANDHRDGDWSLVLSEAEVRPVGWTDDGFTPLKPWQSQPSEVLIKAEFMPRDTRHRQVLAVLEHLRDLCRQPGQPDFGEFHCAGDEPVATVTGWAAWDGVDHRGDFFKDQLPRCLQGRPPDPTVGWPEIHPALFVEANGFTYVPPAPEALLHPPEKQ